MSNKEELKQYFETDDIPTQEQFSDLIDSLALQSNYESLSTTVEIISSDINSISTVVQTNSASWGAISDAVNASTLVHNNSASWDNASMIIQTNSAQWLEYSGTFTGSVTSIGTYLTLSINGSAIAIPIYIYT